MDEMYENALNEWGNDGWELVATVHPAPDSGVLYNPSNSYGLIFKRPK